MTKLPSFFSQSCNKDVLFLNIPTWSLNYNFIRNSLEPYLILKQCLGKVEAIFGL